MESNYGLCLTVLSIALTTLYHWHVVKVVGSIFSGRTPKKSPPLHLDKGELAIFALLFLERMCRHFYHTNFVLDMGYGLYIFAGVGFNLTLAKSFSLSAQYFEFIICSVF